jgi:hypothetical protein
MLGQNQHPLSDPSCRFSSGYVCWTTYTREGWAGATQTGNEEAMISVPRTHLRCCAFKQLHSWGPDNRRAWRLPSRERPQVVLVLATGLVRM